MEYIAEVLFSAAVIALLVIGQRKSPSEHKSHYFFGLAGVIWMLGLLWLQANWIEIFISLVGVLLFAWLINMFIEDARQEGKH